MSAVPATFAEMVAGKTEGPHNVHPRLAHPVADAFPMIPPSDWAGFVLDLKTNGQRDLITLHRDGRIIDGRNRYAACLELGLRPKVETFGGSEEAIVAFVASKNLHRRHLDDPNQRAFIAASLANMKREDSLIPNARDLIVDGATRALASGLLDRANERSSKPSGVVDDPLQGRLISQADAAAALNVNPGAVQRAKAIETHAPELKAAVLAGEMSLGAAADIAHNKARGIQPRHSIHYKTHHLNVTKALLRFTDALEGLAGSTKGIDLSQIDPAELPELTTRIREAMSSLRKTERALTVLAERKTA